MRGIRWPWTETALAIVVLGAGAWALSLHAGAWLQSGDLALDPEAARYPVAARELLGHGRLATLAALPVDLTRDPAPPWALIGHDPGMLALEALAEATARSPSLPDTAAIVRRARLSQALTFGAFSGVAVTLALGTLALLRRHAPALSGAARLGVALLVAAAFVLDPEARHVSRGGLSELPWALGVLLSLLVLALGGAARRPLGFGLLLGATTSFHPSGALVFGLTMSAAAALLAPREGRGRVLLRALLGFALVSTPGWIYAWTTMDEAAARARLALWDGIQGRSLWAMLHLPAAPELPALAAGLPQLAAKAAGNLPVLLGAMTSGPRGLWIGALAMALAAAPTRPLAVAAKLVLAHVALGVIAAALTQPWPRVFFPWRIAAEAAGIVALLGLVARVPEASLPSWARRGLIAAVAVLVLVWGAWQTRLDLANAGARITPTSPAASTLADLASRLARDLPPGESVMSNLGPALAYAAERPVVELALGPDDLEACRARLPFRHVLIVMRPGDRTWPEWQPLLEAGSERGHPEWSILHARRWRSPQGHQIVWLELGPLQPRFASVVGAGLDRGGGAQRTSAMRLTQVTPSTRTRAR